MARVGLISHTLLKHINITYQIINYLQHVQIISFSDILIFTIGDIKICLFLLVDSREHIEPVYTWWVFLTLI